MLAIAWQAHNTIFRIVRCRNACAWRAGNACAMTPLANLACTA